MVLDGLERIVEMPENRKDGKRPERRPCWRDFADRLLGPPSVMSRWQRAYDSHVALDDPSEKYFP